MSFFRRTTLKAKAFFQLGLNQSLNYLLYQIGLRSGYFRLATPEINVNVLLNDHELYPDWFMLPPDVKTMLQISDLKETSLFAEADEILEKKLRFFGGSIHPLMLAPEKDPVHWTHYEKGTVKPDQEDIKFIWEPARFNWAITLGKAYFLRGNEKYASAFWQFFEEFSRSNPTNKGPNWTSAQEVALRLIALIYGAHLMRESSQSTPERLRELAVCIADHADRIPPTICYAKAQNNNHLVSEAVGLFTAATFLPGHPHAARWRKLGLKWFYHAVISQVAPDGTYIQHSTNYQRLFLMLALWMNYLVDKEGDVLRDEILNKLALTTEWLVVRMDSTSGHVPNLGHNDGSNILPLSICAYNDYRPVVQAASRVFLAKPTLPPGQWDDLSLWLEIPTSVELKTTSARRDEKQLILGDQNSWAALRAVEFTSRPAHADQLHVDIWYAGVNLAMDAGTYQYNAAPPWENALAATRIHNTVTIDNLDQMTRAGKFLWLDWAQAEVIERTDQSITAVHNGYSHLGILHRRTLRMEKDNGKSSGKKNNKILSSWVILDELLPNEQSFEKNSKLPTSHINACLNWLIPDWPYKVKGNEVFFKSPVGELRLDIQNDKSKGVLDIYRSGKSQLTNNSNDNLGWYSPTYGVKVPALSIRYSVSSNAPIKITSSFSLKK